MNALYDKTFEHSDKFTVYICRRCGKMAVVNPTENLYRCKTCGDAADICAVNSSYSAKLFGMELEACNIGRRLYLEPFTYETFE